MAEPASIPQKEIKQSLVVIAVIVGLIILSTSVLFTQFWYVWFVLIVCLLLSIGYFAKSKNSYQCSLNHKPFTISATQDFFAPHGIRRSPNGEVYEWKMLKCPECEKRQKCYRVQ